jgi:hypothetical protein
MPNQPKTPARSVRVGVDLWQAAKVTAEQRGETVTDVILRALRQYVEPQNGERSPEASACA